MEKFISLKSIAIPLLRSNIDTDAIIPSREIKGVSKTGLADGMFANWRYKNIEKREINSEFVFNQKKFFNAQILISGINFGCGSSREHAVWALKEWGIRSIFAISFGSIFYSNCIRNGILPIILDKDVIEKFIILAENKDSIITFNINLPEQIIETSDQNQYSFDLLPSYKEMLIQGLDPIGITLKNKEEIQLFQNKDMKNRPWVYI